MRNWYAVLLPAFQQDTANSSSGHLDLKPLLDETMQRDAAEKLTAGCKACQGAIDASRWLATPSDSALYAVNYTAGCAHCRSAACLMWCSMVGPTGSQDQRSCSDCDIETRRAAWFRRCCPFLLASRALLPPFDARFRGYGLDRVSWAQLLDSTGFRYTRITCI